MFRQDRTNPSTAISNWRGRHDTLKGWPSTAVSTWLNGGLFGGATFSYGGYWLGGNGATPDTNAIDVTDFDTEATFTLEAVVTSLPSGNIAPGAHSNNGTAGYAVGYAYGNAVSKILYATNVMATIGGTLTSNVGYSPGGANSPTAGYTFGGYGSSMWADAQRIEKVTYSSDAVAAISATIVGNSGFGSYQGCAVSANGTSIVVANGTGGNGYTTTITKLTISGETTAIQSAVTSQKANGTGGHSNGTSFGYFHLGNSPRVDDIDRYYYAGDSISTLSATSSFVGDSRSGAANSGVAGYVAGGDSAGGKVDTVDKLVYSGETCAAITPTLSNARSTIPNSCANSESL